MSTLKPASWSYAEDFVPEPEVIEQARARGLAFDSAMPVGTGAGAALRMLAAAIAAKHVIEVGTGSGTSGLWLLAGMPEDGVLTTIDISPEHQKAAREAYAEAGYPSQRTRVISGRATDVLPRMTDGAYDMVVIDADKASYPDYVEHGIRLLRSGGVLALDNMLWHDKVADPAARDAETTTLRDLGKTLRDDDALLPALLPVSDGLFVAVKR
ncbi:methyltransferase [Knoellia sinensis KCTC 19936]|uniref:Methyltransferase n=1 Tax=Knoellia sinensis KCTC 19936 TaxID=1385520 RepID=A0A0A0JA44_9MICO|nr:O-methyltransferase [Knoellia sinensis]KGN33654.1 methyltransferase [Knoellia sinensis KCTC 19936]